MFHHSVWRNVLLGFAGLALAGTPAFAHGGHSKDPYHQHQQIKATEVTLQYQTAAAYTQELKKQKTALPTPFDSKLPVLKVILQHKQTHLQARVKLKVTDAQSKSLGGAGGVTPTQVRLR